MTACRSTASARMRARAGSAPAWPWRGSRALRDQVSAGAGNERRHAGGGASARQPRERRGKHFDGFTVAERMAQAFDLEESGAHAAGVGGSCVRAGRGHRGELAPPHLPEGTTGKSNRCRPCRIGMSPGARLGCTQQEQHSARQSRIAERRSAAARHRSQSSAASRRSARVAWIT